MTKTHEERDEMTDTSFQNTGHDHAAPGHEHPADRGARSAAALDGAAPTVAVDAAAGVDTALIEDIEEALRDVVDPELGVNIVDLGLVYDLTVDPARTLTIDMTLTSAACPLTDMIEDQVGAALMGPGEELVADYRINWVWLPPWGPERITDEGREQLRALGFNI
jgi:metal-sulfur cluster biosynthetic enzyme